MIPRDLITATGRALYGERWQFEMARALGRTVRTVQRWAVGDAQPLPDVCAKLLRLCAERRNGIYTVEKMLEKTKKHLPDIA